MAQQEGTILDIQGILSVLPHRSPFLLVDRILSMEEGKRCVGIKNVTYNEPFFTGHFPGAPVMPGVLIVEAMAQAGAILATRSGKFDLEKHVIYFMALDKVKFRKPVVPGDQLTLEVVPLRKGESIWKMAGQASVDDKVVCSAEFLASIAPRQK